VDHVDDVPVGRDIAAHDAERLAERAFDHRHAVRDLVTLRNAAAAGAVHADGVDLVEIGDRAVFVGEVADLGDRSHVAVHRIDAFEGDQLRRVGGRCLQKLFEMNKIVVPEDLLLAP
jgi:hypothetical protein